MNRMGKMGHNRNIKLSADNSLKSIDFSVLMSVYKKENPDYLKAALDSVINQTLVPTEIVLVKDGPLTDSLEEVIRTYQSKHSFFKVIELEKNVGLGKSLNEGMKHCSFDIVARMDTDDYCEQDRFEKQISVLVEQPELDVVGSCVCEYDESLNKVSSTRSVPEKDIEIKSYLKKRNPLNHVSVMYRKDKVLAAGGYIDCPYFEDYYLWCRMAKNGCKFYNIQDSLVRVRAGAGMINRRGGLSYAKNAIHFEKEILKLRIIGVSGFIYNSSVRTAVALFPNNLRQMLYLKILRKNEG